MIWVAIEDANTHEVSEFVLASEEQVLDLMDVHKADMGNATRICLQDVEGALYCGVAYKGRFGYNILAAKKIS